MSIIHYKIYCETDTKWERWFLDDNDPAPTTCPVDSAHTITTDSISIISTTGPDDVIITNVPNVITKKPTTSTETSRTYSFSIDWTKKETWHYDAVKVVNEFVGVGDGVTTAFSLAHGGPTTGEVILNLTNGLVTDEQFIFSKVTPAEPYPTGVGFGYGYSPLVLIDYPDTDPPVPQVEQNTYDPGSQGHYMIDHANGVINFWQPPSLYSAVIVTYWYVPSDAKGTMSINPPPGKRWLIDVVEAQFSEDIIMNDVVLQNQYSGETPIYPMNVEYRTMGAFCDYTFGSFPVVPPLGGPTRGLSKPTVIMRWEFATTVAIDSNQSIRSWLKNGIPFGGERATLTWYAVEENDV